MDMGNQTPLILLAVRWPASMAVIGSHEHEIEAIWARRFDGCRDPRPLCPQSGSEGRPWSRPHQG